MVEIPEKDPLCSKCRFGRMTKVFGNIHIRICSYCGNVQDKSGYSPYGYGSRKSK